MSIAAGPSCSRASSSEPVTQLDPCSVSSESVQLGSVWQRLADDRWIVGLAVHNGTSRLVPLLVTWHKKFGSWILQSKLEEAGAHKSAKTHTGTLLFLVTLTFWPQNIWVSRTRGGPFLC